MPMVLATLQRSIYAVALGKPTKPDFFSNGVPRNSLIEEVKPPGKMAKKWKTKEFIPILSTVQCKISNP